MNIFARELAALLNEHGRSLSSLYMLHSDFYQISPNKVTRLRQSLEKDITATLNAEELRLVAELLQIDSEGPEIRRLRAALVAESIRHLLGGRMERDKALVLGETAFQLLLDEEPETLLALRATLLEGVRGNIPLEGNGLTTSSDQIEQALEPAVQTYEEGALWLELARDAQECATRLGYLAQVQTLLERAKDLAINAPAIAVGTPQQRDWLAVIEEALAQAKTLC